MDIRPFADDAAAYEADGIVVENGTDRIKIDVSRSFGRSRSDLEDLRVLHRLIGEMVIEIEATPYLPEKLAPERPAVVSVRNPFA